MEKDMTAGTPGKIIFNFTMPIFIGNIFQQFYNMADTVIVGKFVGNAALAAVGACGTLVFLIIGFLQGVTAGVSGGSAHPLGTLTLRSRKHEGDEEVCGIRCGTYRDRNRYSYIAEHDQYGEGAAFDEYTVRHVWRSLRIYYGHLRRDCGTGALQLSCKCIKGTRR